MGRILIRIKLYFRPFLIGSVNPRVFSYQDNRHRIEPERSPAAQHPHRPGGAKVDLKHHVQQPSRFIQSFLFISRELNVLDLKSFSYKSA